jgi:tetratricopeptide (TPR) repeat protein
MRDRSFSGPLSPRRWIGAGAAALVVLSGCASPEAGSSGHELWKRVARAVALGRAYDRGVLAARSGDEESLARASERIAQLSPGASGRLRRQAPLSPAEEAVVDALRWSSRAELASRAVASAPPGSAALVRAQMALEQTRTREAQAYRRAQRLQPRFSSPDPQKLNALGYFLAERGEAKADFLEAERLTRLSLREWDALVEAETDPRARVDWAFSRANTRDSLAWALYRLGRHEEAAREQEKALAEARSSIEEAADRFGQALPMPSELHYHLDAIYRALGREKEARAQFEEALRLSPTDEAARRALQTPGVTL